MQAQSSVREADAFEPSDELDFELVHVSGVATNNDKVEDTAFGVEATDSYRLIRTVQMYQTKETVTERKHDNRVERKFSYRDDWYNYQIPSENFNDATKRSNNPHKPWPFTSKTHDARCINLGKFILSNA